MYVVLAALRPEAVLFVLIFRSASAIEAEQNSRSVSVADFMNF